MMAGVADDAAGDTGFADGRGVLVYYWCTLGGRGRQHCGSNGLW